jgi:hypothetical protein
MRQIRSIAVSLLVSGLLLGSTGPPAPGAAGLAAAASFVAPSQMYVDAMTHAQDRRAFSPGAPVSVPFRPRSSDHWSVDGDQRLGTDPGLLTATSTSAGPDRETFGFLPYWELGTSLDFSALATLAYFGVGTGADGSLLTATQCTDGSSPGYDSGWCGWQSANLSSTIDAAHGAGVRVVLTVQRFAYTSSQQTAAIALLSSSTARQHLAITIAAAVAARKADGVNLDFEPIPTGQSANFVDLVRRVRAALDAVAPGQELTVDTFGRIGSLSYQRTSGYDVIGLTAPGAADALFITGYDYRSGTASRAGSIDPLGGTLSATTLRSTVAAYLAETRPSNLILGSPWYGRTWSVSSPIDHALTLTPACSVTPIYGQIAEELLPSATKSWDAPEDGPYLTYPEGPTSCHSGTLTRELYYDDPQSLADRYALVNGAGLRGSGIWALGYDTDPSSGIQRPELYDALHAAFDAAGDGYAPLAPVRILDTRASIGLAGRFISGVPRQLSIAGHFSVPADAGAVTVNLTVTRQSAPGYVALTPVPTASPAVSSLNFPLADDRANGAIATLGPDGGLGLVYRASSGATTDLVLDLTGYFDPSAPSTYHPVVPVRLLDTRVGNALAGAFLANQPRTFALAGRGGIAADAVAVTGNLTVTDQSAAGYVALTRAPTATPGTSTLNFPTGDTRANGVTVPLGDDGKLSAVYRAVSGATAELIFDLTGYFTPDRSGATYHPLLPLRVLDTRLHGGFGPLAVERSRTFAVAATAGLPADARAVSGNLTVTGQTAGGYITLTPAPPTSLSTSSLNFPHRDNRANNLASILGANGTLSATYGSASASAQTHLLFDLDGFFR